MMMFKKIRPTRQVISRALALGLISTLSGAVNGLAQEPKTSDRPTSDTIPQPAPMDTLKQGITQDPNWMMMGDVAIPVQDGIDQAINSLDSGYQARQNLRNQKP